MEGQGLFFEDRAGNMNSKQRKRKFKNQQFKNICKSEQMDSTEEPLKKQSKSFHRKGHHSYPQNVDKRNSSEYISKDNESSSPNSRNAAYRENSISFQRKKFNKNDKVNSFESYDSKKNDSSQPPEKDKKLIELVSYYEKILQTLKSGLSNEDSGNLFPAPLILCFKLSCKLINYTNVVEIKFYLFFLYINLLLHTAFFLKSVIQHAHTLL